MTPRLRRTEERYQAFERAVSPAMLVLSILFIPIFILSLIPGLVPTWRRIVETFEWAIWGAFAVEYLIRITIAPRRLRVVREHIFDLLVLALPFLRPLRALRAARSLGRFALTLGGTATLGRAMTSARRVARRRGPHYVVLLVCLATVVGALIVLNVEIESREGNIHSLGDALWWAVSTITTVGYGDRYPVTTEGRVIAVVLMILGLGLFSVVTAGISSFFVNER